MERKNVPGLKIPLKLRKVMNITYVCIYIVIYIKYIHNNNKKIVRRKKP